MLWYAGIFLSMFGLSIAFLYVYDTGLPWYGLVLSIAIIVVLLVPTGIMLAICNIQLSTAAISALIAGYAWPGMMMNNVVFKVFTLVSSVQGLGYVKDMKIGYYMVSLFFLGLSWDCNVTQTKRVENPSPDDVYRSMRRDPRVVVDSDCRESMGHGACRGCLYPGCQQQRTTPVSSSIPHS